VPVIDRRLIAASRDARWQLVRTVLFGLCAAGLVLAQAGALTDVVVDVSTGRPVSAWRASLLVLALVVGARALVAFATEATALRAAETVRTGLRGRLLAAVLQRGPIWLQERRSGELTTLVTRGLDALDVYFARFLPAVGLAVVVPPVVLLRIAAADWVSALLLAVTAPLVPAFMVLIGLYTRSRTARQWGLLARLGGHFLDVVEGLPTLKVFGRARAQVEVIRRITDAHRRATMSTLRVAFLSALVLELLATVGTALVAVAVGLRLLDGSLNYSTALLVLLLAPEVYLPLRALGGQFHSSMEGVAAAGQALDVLDGPGPAPTGSTGGVDELPVDLRAARIDVCDVSLAYPGRELPALDSVSLAVEPGSLVVVTGESGSGKSSLLALLMRFVEPTGGEIRIGGHRLDELPVQAWREQVGWVSQDPHLFAGSVADNVRLGCPGATDGAVEEALERAGAAVFVGALPEGSATQIGERGLRLSTGQRQRIALARAFLRDAPLVLLDEPTAHLDPITAGGIRQAVEGLMANRTVLLVTHHQAWAARADAVITVQHGCVARTEQVLA
jgi:ATP-binding cassette subfamily C protein CydD